MIDKLPFTLPAGVIAIALTMIFLLHRATKGSRATLIIVCGWLFLQAALAYFVPTVLLGHLVAIRRLA